MRAGLSVRWQTAVTMLAREIEEEFARVKGPTEYRRLGEDALHKGQHVAVAAEVPIELHEGLLPGPRAPARAGARLGAAALGRECDGR